MIICWIKSYMIRARAGLSSESRNGIAKVVRGRLAGEGRNGEESLRKFGYMRVVTRMRDRYLESER